MRRALSYTLLGLLLLAGLLATAAGWLLYTEAGLQWALRRALPLVQEQVSVEQISGTLAGPLEIQGLQVRTEAMDLSLDQARLRWSPVALLSGRVRIEELTAGALLIRMHRLPDAEPKAPSPLPQPLLPVAVVIEDLRLAQLQWFAASEEPSTEPPPANLDLQDIQLQAQLIDRFFRVDQLQAQWAPAGLVQAQARGELLGDGLQLEQLQLQGPGSLQAEGALYWIEPRADLRVQWQALQWPPQEPQLDSPDGELRLQGPLAALAVNGQARLGAETQLQVDGTVGETLDLGLRWTQLRWPLRGEQPPLRSPQGDLQWSGSLQQPRLQGQIQLPGQARLAVSGLVDPQNLDLRLQWQQLQWPLQTADNAPPQVRSAQGVLDVQGALQQWRFELSAALQRPQAQGAMNAQLSASGQGDAQSLQARRLRLVPVDARGQSQGQLDGTLALNWARQRLQADLQLDQLNPGIWAPAWSGKLNGQLQARAGWQQTMQLEASWQLSDSRLRGRNIASRAQVQMQDARIMVSELQLDSGESRLQASGQVWPQLEAQARLDSPQLDDLWPGLQGQAQLRLQVRGEPSLPMLELQGEAKALQLAQLRAGEVELAGRFDPQGPLQLELRATDLYAGEAIDSVQLTAQGRIDDHSLKLQVEAPRGALSSEWGGAYDPQQQRWQGAWRSAELTPKELAPWQLAEPAALMLSAAEARLEPACWRSDEGRLCGQTHWVGQEWLSAWRLERFDLAALQPFLPADWRAQGTLTGTGRVVVADGQLDAARIALQTSTGRLSAGPKARLDFAASELTFTESNSDGGDLALALMLPDGALRLQAQLSPGAVWGERALSGRLQADWPDVSALALLSPELGEIQGSLQGEFTLGGQLQRPRLDGELQLQDGQLALLTPGITLKELKARLSADGEERIQLQAQARSGEGELKVDGHWALFETGRQIGLQVTGEQVLAVNTPEAKVWVSPDLSLELEGDQARLQGTVKVPKARVTPERFSGGGVGPSPDQVILDAEGQRPEERGLKLSSQVKLVLGDDVRFDGFGLKTRLAGQIEATDQPGRLTAGRGELRLIGGRYQAYGQDLTIETGRLLFDGGPITNPGLDLRATREPREDILVGVQVRGALDAPQLNLFSDPPMSQDQQLSWLVLGRSVGAGSDDAQREAVASAALALGLRGSDFVAGKIGDKLGLDEISIGSKPGQTADQARFTIGKYLSPRLYVSYGVGLFQPGHSVQLEYDLGGGFKLSTETGVESGGDLIYSIER